MRKLLDAPRQTKKVPFLGKANAVEIVKLTGLEVRSFQRFVKDEVPKLDDAEKNSAVTHYLIRVGVPEAAEMTDEELLSFPLEDMNELVKSILSFSGVNTGDDAPNS